MERVSGSKFLARRIFPSAVQRWLQRDEVRFCSKFAEGGRRFAAQPALSEIPGPPCLPVIGNLHNFNVNCILEGNLRPLYAQYGQIFKVTLVGTDLVFLSDVNMAREVLKDRASDFTNGDQFRAVFGSMFPTSVIVVEGEQWQRVRRILQRAMQGTRVSEVIRPMYRVVDRADQLKITGGQACDVHRLVSNITFDTFGIWAYDVELNMTGGENTDLLQACEVVTEALCWRMMKMPVPILWKLPTPLNRKLQASLVTIKAHASRLLDSAKERISERKSSGIPEGSKSNLLDAIVLASMAEHNAKDQLTDEEMLDNMCTIFFGAYDTTSATLAFTLQFLAEHSDAQTTLAEELAGIDLQNITRAELESLSYLDMVTKETNRLRSTAIGFPRTAKVDTQIGGFAVRGGMNFMIDHTSLTSRDPELWGNQQDLDKFRPARWGEVKPHRLASLPFGFGARMCIGTQVANMEHKLITALLVQRYRWRVDPERPMEVTTKLGLTPKDGCWLIPETRA